MTAEMQKFYTLKDLEELTGFDGRTIYFYVQEGLVPKLGRRGRTSQYPQAFLDRLLFIKQLKGLQDTGRIGPITLRDIRKIMQTISPETVARVAAGEEPLQAIELDTEWEGLTSDRFSAAGATQANSVEQIRDMGVGFSLEPSSTEESEEDGDPDEWTTLSVTDDILLTVRGRDAKAMPLVQKLIRLIRRMVGEG